MVSNGVDARLPQPDDPDSPDAEVIGGKKKRGGRAARGEKGGKGLCHFSIKVCQNVESEGRTTYNEMNKLPNSLIQTVLTSLLIRDLIVLVSVLGTNNMKEEYTAACL